MESALKCGVYTCSGTGVRAPIGKQMSCDATLIVVGPTDGNVLCNMWQP